MRYSVTVRYKGQATIDVIADHEIEAEEKAIAEVRALSVNLDVLDVTMSAFGAHAEKVP